jgi:hypothetical protein
VLKEKIVTDNLKITGVKLLPLKGKYYETSLVVEVGDGRLDDVVYIRLQPGWGIECIPSEREVDGGWKRGDDLDHTEFRDVYELAKMVENMLREKVEE